MNTESGVIVVGTMEPIAFGEGITNSFHQLLATTMRKILGELISYMYGLRQLRIRMVQ